MKSVHVHCISAVVIVGDCGVGKTSLLHRMVQLDVGSAHDDNQKDYHMKMAVVEGASAPVKIQLWDTAGQEKFGAARLPSSFFRHAHAAIVVYDVTDRRSFENVLQWVKQLHDYLDNSFVLTLVGNKCDVKHPARQASEAEGLVVAKAISARHFFECSTTTDTNVHACFTAIAADLANNTP